jgi:hypothetical protein
VRRGLACIVLVGCGRVGFQPSRDGASTSLDDATFAPGDGDLVDAPAGTTIAGVAADTYLCQSGCGGNTFGTAAVLYLTLKREVLVRFDLSSAPAQTITNAQLRLYMYNASGSPGPFPVDVHRVTEVWDPAFASWTMATSTTAWTTGGGAYDATVAATTMVDTSQPYTKTWDITSLVNGWVVGGIANNGLILTAPGMASNASFGFASQEMSSASGPQLWITQ